MDRVGPDQLTRLLGFGVHTVERERGASGGLHSDVYACQSDVGELILRVCRGQQGFYTHYFPDRVAPHRWLDQRWAVTQAREVGVPAPEVLYTNRTLRWVVMKRLPGVPIDARYETWKGCPYDESEFGEILARLHSVTPLGFGPIDDEGSPLFETWAAFLRAAANSATETCRRRNSLPNELSARLADAWIPRLENAELGRPSLLHLESLGFSNIIYSPETRRITGLIDYEDCIGGDPLFERMWMEFYFEHDGRNQEHFDFGRFEEGYGTMDRSEERRLLYGAFPYLDKLRWIDPDGDRAREYREKLDRLLTQL
jgi:aminoglycoside phosphotransferase (APT) family kinase protein